MNCVTLLTPNNCNTNARSLPDFRITKPQHNLIWPRALQSLLALLTLSAPPRDLRHHVVSTRRLAYSTTAVPESQNLISFSAASPETGGYLGALSEVRGLQRDGFAR